VCVYSRLQGELYLHFSVFVLCVLWFPMTLPVSTQLAYVIGWEWSRRDVKGSDHGLIWRTVRCCSGGSETKHPYSCVVCWLNSWMQGLEWRRQSVLWSGCGPDSQSVVPSILGMIKIFLSRNVHARCEGLPSSCSLRTGVERPRREAVHLPLPVPGLRMSGAVPPRPLYVLTVWAGTALLLLSSHKCDSYSFLCFGLFPKRQFTVERWTLARWYGIVPSDRAV
jgi:hypothetical protein